MGTLQAPAGRPIFCGQSGPNRITLLCYDDGAMGISRNDEEVELWRPEDAEACMSTFLSALDRPAKLGRRESGPRANFQCDPQPSSIASVENTPVPDTAKHKPATDAPPPTAASPKVSDLENLKKTLAAAPSALRYAIMARINLAQDVSLPGLGKPVRKGHSHRVARPRTAHLAPLQSE
ncbi:MAG: hypothetical protein JWO87_312 [Phycisphaerales bacterium]|nr:hypothetical protein [Phycisphaerales bacterium]